MFLRVFAAVELLLNAFPELPWQRPFPPAAAPPTAVVAEPAVKKPRKPRSKKPAKVEADQFEFVGLPCPTNTGILMDSFEELADAVRTNNRLPLETSEDLTEQLFAVRMRAIRTGGRRSDIVRGLGGFAGPVESAILFGVPRGEPMLDSSGRWKANGVVSEPWAG